MSDAATPTLRTARLELHRVELEDAAFFLKLLNDPSWIANIGDRGVRSQADAASYISTRIWSQYDTYGYGMYVVRATGTTEPMGLCGLVRREFLPGPDLGFALLPAWVGAGFATEAAGAVIEHAEGTLAIKALYAITSPANQRSIRVLERLAFREQGPFCAPGGETLERYVRP